MEQQSKVKLEDRIKFISNVNNSARTILEDFSFLSDNSSLIQIELKKNFEAYNFNTSLNSDDMSEMVNILHRAVSRHLKGLISHEELQSPSNITLLESLKEIEALYKKDYSREWFSTQINAENVEEWEKHWKTNQKDAE